MTSLRSKFVVPALLAGAAALAGCNAQSPHDDLAGMTDSIAEACPTEYKDTQTRLQCATVGQSHAKTLLEYSGINEQFQKSCNFKAVSPDVPAFAAPQVIGAQTSKCLNAIEDVAADDVVKQKARDIRTAMAVGLS